jgi:hypothetical protein
MAGVMGGIEVAVHRAAALRLWFSQSLWLAQLAWLPTVECSVGSEGCSEAD